MNIICKNIIDLDDEFSVNIESPGDCYVIVYGFGDIKKKISVKIISESVNAHIIGLFIGSSGNCKIETVQHHAAPRSMSNLRIKTILSGDACFSYRGIIKMEQIAQQSDAYQQNDNLIMSPNVHINTKPELEIIANDVKCSHGATIGKLDEHALYYVASRGIDYNTAKALVVEGYVRDILDDIPNDGKHRDIVSEFMENSLEKINF